MEMRSTWDEWWRRPSTEGCSDYSSRDSTEKGLGLDEKVSKNSICLSNSRSNSNDNRAIPASIEAAPKQSMGL